MLKNIKKKLFAVETLSAATSVLDIFSELVTSIVARQTMDIKAAERSNCNFFLHSTFLQSTLFLLFASDVPIVKPISDDITNYFLLAVFFFVIDQSHSLETMIAIRFERSEKERKNKIRKYSRLNDFCYLLLRATGCFASIMWLWSELRGATLPARRSSVTFLSSSILPLFPHVHSAPTSPRPVETGKWSSLKNRTVLRRSLMNCVVRIHIHEKWGNSDNCCRGKFFWKAYW